MVKDSSFFLDRFGISTRTGSAILDENVTYSSGEKWKRLRTLFATAFTAERLRKCVPLILDSVEKRSLEFNELIERSRALNEDVDIWRFIAALSLDMVSESFFKMKCRPEEEDEVALHSQKFFGRKTLDHIMFTIFGFLYGDPPFFTKAAVEGTAKVAHFQNSVPNPKPSSFLLCQYQNSSPFFRILPRFSVPQLLCTTSFYSR
jgi:hypothetical protein